MSVPTIIETLCEIDGQLRGMRASIKRQTEIMVMMKNQTSSNESANKPKEAAKTITWQEAVKTLRDICKNQDCCDDCVALEWCYKALPTSASALTPNYWEVPGDE